jgi:hypothetical protein
MRAVCVGKCWRWSFLSRDRENCGVQGKLVLCRGLPEQETASEKQGDKNFHIWNGSRQRFGYNCRKTLHLWEDAVRAYDRGRLRLLAAVVVVWETWQIWVVDSSQDSALQQRLYRNTLLAKQ